MAPGEPDHLLRILPPARAASASGWADELAAAHSARDCVAAERRFPQFCTLLLRRGGGS
jgi:hypothetical protein